MCPAKIWQPYDILVLIWLVAKILVASEKLPTYLTFPSQFLPKLWSTQGQGILSHFFWLANLWQKLIGHEMT
jgi:hypothetical protein